MIEAPLAEELAALDRSAVPELQKARRRAKARRAQRAVRLHPRCIDATGLCDDGRLVTSVDVVEAELARHGGAVESESELDAAALFLGYIVEGPPRQCHITQGSFRSAARATMDR